MYFPFFNRSLKSDIKQLWHIKVLLLLRGRRPKGQVILHMLQSTEISLGFQQGQLQLWIQNKRVAQWQGFREHLPKGFRQSQIQLLQAPIMRCLAEPDWMLNLSRSITTLSRSTVLCSENCLTSGLAGLREERAQITPCRNVPRETDSKSTGNEKTC